MTKCVSRVAGMAFVVVILFAAFGFAPGQRDGVLSGLKPGMPVSLSENAGRYEIGVFSKGPEVLGYKVLEVGADYLVLEDISGIKELRIPLYSIKSVITTKLPAGK
jgi:hypothetical protein